MRVAIIVLLLPALVRSEVPCKDIKACIPSCKKGDAASCAALGDFLLGVKEKKSKKGLKALARACVAHEEACFHLGRVLTTRKATGRKGARGYEVLVDLCEKKSHQRACTLLAAKHETEDGIAFDLDKAEGLYEKSCNSGSAGDGCFRLARLRERNGREVGTIPDLFIEACAGGVKAACERVIANGMPEEWSPAFARLAAHKFIDACFYKRSTWIKSWWNDEVPRPTIRVLGTDGKAKALSRAVGDAIPYNPSVTLAEPVAYVVVPDIDEHVQSVEVGHAAKNVEHRLFTHLALSLELRAAETRELICRDSTEVSFAETLPPPPGPTGPPVGGCLISDRHATQIAEDLAEDLVVGPWLKRFTTGEGREPRVRFRRMINKTNAYLDLRAIVSDLEERLQASGKITVLEQKPASALGAKVADVVGILHMESRTDVMRGHPVVRYQAMLQLISTRTGEVVWVTDRLAHLCPYAHGEFCGLTGTELRAMVYAMIADAGASKGVANFTRCEGHKPTVRISRIMNKSDERISLSAPTRAALALDGAFELLVDKGGNLAAVQAEQDLSVEGASGDRMVGQASSADLVMNVIITSVMDQTDKERFKFYKLNAELLNAETGEKIWIGDREEQLICEQAAKIW